MDGSNPFNQQPFFPSANSTNFPFSEEEHVYRSIISQPSRSLPVNAAKLESVHVPGLPFPIAPAYGNRSPFEEIEEPVYRSLSILAPPSLVHHNDGAARVAKFTSFATDLKRKATPMKDSKDSTLSHQVVCAPALPKGYVVEARTHFYSEANPVVLLKKIAHDLIENQHADCQMKQQKFKVKGLCYIQSRCVSFKVSLFSCGPQKTVVDFQRRHGDILSFNHVYRSVLCALSEVGLVCDVDQSAAKRLKQVHHDLIKCGDESLVSNLAAECTLEDQENLAGLQPVVQLACSEFVELQAEGARALAAMSGDHCNHSLLVDEVGVSAVVSLARSKEHGVMRSAAVTIANIASNKTLSKHLVDEGVIEPLLSLLHEQSSNVDILRESVRALEHLSQSCAHQMSASGVADKLRRIHTTDSRLSSSIAGTLHNLSTVSV
eukprot:GILK01000470.1.p1 GENE.GILK01000470.1~~GILK01000470.1.p1  ORF type:complete len:471 (-),score=67.74 GILK01000470.1:63-1364(-)